MAAILPWTRLPRMLRIPIRSRDERDGDARLLQRLVLRDGVYAIVDAQEGDVVFQPDSFEGLEIDLSLLWAE